jgi:hypothetical protein
MSWFIFTYGMLIYTQLGASAESEFTKVRDAAALPPPPRSKNTSLSAGF